jgi:hypothetical protein
VWVSIVSLLAVPAAIGLHRAGMAEDEGKGLLGTQVREPRPGEDPCDRDDEVVTIGRNRRETRLRAGLHVLVQHDLAVLVEDADVHGAGLPIEATVCLVLWGVKAPAVSSCFASGFSRRQRSHRGLLRGRPLEVSTHCSGRAGQRAAQLCSVCSKYEICHRPSNLPE